MEKLRIDRPVIVEGKYDKIALSAVLDATIITTGGFSLFKNKERVALLRRLSAPRGVILLTDADGGGGDGLTVEDLALVEAHVESEPVLYHAEQDFGLYLAHQSDGYFLGFGVI